MYYYKHMMYYLYIEDLKPLIFHFSYDSQKHRKPVLKFHPRTNWVHDGYFNLLPSLQC